MDITEEQAAEALQAAAAVLLGALRRRGRDVVLVGYGERSASILANARVATAAVLRSTAERLGGERLVVGGQHGRPGPPPPGP